MIISWEDIFQWQTGSKQNWTHASSTFSGWVSSSHWGRCSLVEFQKSGQICHSGAWTWRLSEKTETGVWEKCWDIQRERAVLSLENKAAWKWELRWQRLWVQIGFGTQRRRARTWARMSWRKLRRMGHSKKEWTENLHLLQNLILFKISDFNSILPLANVSKSLWQTTRAGLNTEQKLVLLRIILFLARTCAVSLARLISITSDDVSNFCSHFAGGRGKGVKFTLQKQS